MRWGKALNYICLGSLSNEAPEYLQDQEKYMIAKRARKAAVVKHRELWNCNRYGVLKIWKGVMVLGLMYQNAVLCMGLQVQAGLEVK